jgi:hypothetical protein
MVYDGKNNILSLSEFKIDFLNIAQGFWTPCSLTNRQSFIQENEQTDNQISQLKEF